MISFLIIVLSISLVAILLLYLELRETSRRLTEYIHINNERVINYVNGKFKEK